MAENIPVALTIAGSDSGGGAGIEADLRAFWAHGVHGCAAITALTAQNPFGVGLVQGADPAVLRDQLGRVADAFALRAAKTGMLLNAALIGVAADFAEAHPALPLVVDPVMVATSGARLLDDSAVGALTARLLPRAALVTPNRPEAAVLLGQPLHAVEAAPQAAARALAERLGVRVLLKGGHAAARVSLDILAAPDGTCLAFEAPCVEAPLTTHGTGCALSAAIAAGLALGQPLREAVAAAKAYVANLLAAAVPAGRAAVYGFAPPAFTSADVRVSVLP